MGLERAGRQVDVNGLFLFIRLRRVDAGTTAEYPFVSIVGNEMQSTYQLIQRVISVVEDLGEGAHFHLRFRSAGHFVFGKREIVKFPGSVLAPLIADHQIGMLTGAPFPDEPGAWPDSAPSLPPSRLRPSRGRPVFPYDESSAFTQRTPRKTVSSKMKMDKRIGRNKNIKFRSVIF